MQAQRAERDAAWLQAYPTGGASEATSQQESLQQQASSYNGTEAPSGGAAGVSTLDLLTCAPRIPAGADRG